MFIKRSYFEEIYCIKNYLLLGSEWVEECIGFMMVCVYVGFFF